MNNLTEKLIKDGNETKRAKILNFNINRWHIIVHWNRLHFSKGCVS